MHKLVHVCFMLYFFLSRLPNVCGKYISVAVGVVLGYAKFKSIKQISVWP